MDSELKMQMSEFEADKLKPFFLCVIIVQYIMNIL